CGDRRRLYLSWRTDTFGAGCGYWSRFPAMTLDAKILSALRNAGAVSGADLSHSLGVTRAAIWARIEDLRSFGYEIEASPHQGYKLLNVPDVLHADDLLSLVPSNQIVGRDVRVFEETESTN